MATTKSFLLLSNCFIFIFFHMHDWFSMCALYILMNFAYFYNYFIGGKNSIMFFQEKMHWYDYIGMMFIIIAITVSLVCLQVMPITCILNASKLWLVLHAISCDILVLFILVAESAVALLWHQDYWTSGYSYVSLIF